MNLPNLIRTPDQRLRVFISSTMRELANERLAVKEAVTQLRMAPVMFELGARPHPAISLYRAYLEQSHIFIGIYWQSYGYVGPGMEVSGLEDEYCLAREKPKLIYIKNPASDREVGLLKLLNRIRDDDRVSYKYFNNAEELRQLVENDLAILLTERFEVSELSARVPASNPEHRQHNLPAQLTSFIGREAEIAAVKELLERQQVRLLTLTGPGGTGKTRLSLQVADGLLNQYKDGVFFVPLAEARQPDLVVSKIAETLGVREGGSQSLFESIKSFLRNMQLLLLLDNFEQVLEASPLVSDMLESAPQLKILVTSRAPLHLRGEHEFQVPTLQLPDVSSILTIEQMTSYEAVRMFVERAQAIHARFVLDDHNASMIAEICRRLDGLPLAIELATARLRMLSVEKLLSMLSNRLNLLTGGRRDLPERQQTLRNTLEWSVQLLSQNDQILFARLGVFMGGFSLDSVQEVCHLEDGANLDVFQGLESLLNNSLIQSEFADSPEPRFHMLETLREFAQEKLAGMGELEAMQGLHARYFVRKIGEMNPLFITREADQALAWVDHERDNMRAALAYCFTEESLLEITPFLLTEMAWPWYRRGFLSEGREWANRLLRSQAAQRQSQGQRLGRSYALWCSGAMAMWQGDLNDALTKLEEAVATSKAMEFPSAIAVALLFLGTTQVNRGEDQVALQNLQEAMEIFQQLSMFWYQAASLVHMGNACLGMGHIDLARTYLEQALTISQPIGENWLTSFILNNYGEVARTEGDYECAGRYYQQSEDLLRAMGDKGDLARLVHNQGCVARHTGNMALAEERFKESLAMFMKLGNQRGIAECLASLAGLWFENGQLLDAVKLLGAAQALLGATGAVWWPADRVEVERSLENLRQNLEPARFEIAWESGKRMDLEAALAYAQVGQS